MLRVVHQGRGGHVEVSGRRYAIEHVGDGRFVVHVPSGQGRRASDLAELEALVRSDPAKWALERRDGARR